MAYNPLPVSSFSGDLAFNAEGQRRLEHGVVKSF
jgi:hypothetical protein